MPRPPKSRRICHPPKMKGFKPYGIALCQIESIKLSLEEYESIKLVDYEMMSQDQAAEQMAVSRPTFTRIYNKALKVIAKALVQGMALEIEGGNYELENEWYRCKKCFKLIEGLENHTKCSNCTLFGKDELIHINQLTDDKR